MLTELAEVMVPEILILPEIVVSPVIAAPPAVTVKPPASIVAPLSIFKVLNSAKPVELNVAKVESPVTSKVPERLEFPETFSVVIEVLSKVASPVVSKVPVTVKFSSKVILSVLKVPFTVSVLACISPSIKGSPDELSESIINL